MAKYRIPRDTDVEGTLTVSTGLNVEGTTALNTTGITGNTTIDGDLQVTGSVTTAGSVATVKVVSTDHDVNVIEIVVNSDRDDFELVSNLLQVFVLPHYDVLDISLNAPGVDTIDIQIYITNETGERQDLEVIYRANFTGKNLAYVGAQIPSDSLINFIDTMGLGNEFSLQTNQNASAEYQISYRNANLVDEVVRREHNSAAVYRTDRDIDADFVPVDPITGVLTPSNDPVANVQEALVGIQGNIDAVTVGTLNITAGDVSINEIDGVSTPTNDAQEALESLQGNIDAIGPWVAGAWARGDIAIYNRALYVLGAASKSASDIITPDLDANWSNYLEVPDDLAAPTNSVNYVLSYTHDTSGNFTEVDLRRANTLHVFTEGVAVTDTGGNNIEVKVIQNDHVELRLGGGMSDLYISAAPSTDILINTVDFQAFLDDPVNSFLKVQLDEDVGHVEAGLLSVDTTSPTSTASLGLFYDTITTGSPDVVIDFSELENEIIANDTRLDRLDGNFHGSGLALISQADTITYGFGNSVLVTVPGIVGTDLVDVGDFIGLEDGVALTDLTNPGLLDIKLKVTARAVIGNTDTRYTASIISVVGTGILSTTVFVYGFVDDPADGDIVVVNPSRELRNVNATDGSVSVSGNVISAGVHSGIVNANAQEIELFYGTAPTGTADVDVDISAIATPAFSLDALINSIHQENAEEYEGGTDFLTIYSTLVDPHAEDFYNSLGLFLVFEGSLTDINTLIPDGTHYYLFDDANNNLDEVFTTTIPRVVLRATNYRNHLGGTPAVTQVKFSVIRGLNNIFDSDYTGGTRTLDTNDPIHDYLWRGDKADTATRSRHTLQEKVDGDLVLTEKPTASTTEGDDDDGTLTTKDYVDFKVITYADIVNGAGRIESSGEVSGNQFIEYSHPGSPGVNFFRIFLAGEEEIRRDSSTGDIILTREY